MLSFDILILSAWYYYGPSSHGQMPSHPTVSSLMRASTLSLGSIAFGSLIVTILEIIRLVLNAARQYANADGHRTSPVNIRVPSS
jgi:Plasma-membrane choline transporter